MRINDSERKLWVENDEELYTLFIGTWKAPDAMLNKPKKVMSAREARQLQNVILANYTWEKYIYDCLIDRQSKKINDMLNKQKKMSAQEARRLQNAIHMNYT
jgi:hypothetical protein